MDGFVEVEGREHEDANRWRVADDLSGGLDPVHPGHSHVHQRDIRLGLQRLGHGGRAIGGFADDVDVSDVAEQPREALPDKLLVVDQ